MHGIKSSPLSLSSTSTAAALTAGGWGGRSNRAGLAALCTTAVGLTLTGIMADSHRTLVVGRGKKEQEWRFGLNSAGSAADLSA